MTDYNKEDLLMTIYDDYEEKTTVAVNEISLTGGVYTLWQTIEGELKTKLGEVDCETFRNYGSRLHELLGQPMTELLNREIEYYVELVMDNYPEVESWTIETTTERKEGKIRFVLSVYYLGEDYAGVVEIG
jgi:phage baseplate assembly protein W